MTYRNPRFLVDHYLRRENATITGSNTDSNFPESRLKDDQSELRWKSASTAAFQTIVMDKGDGKTIGPHSQGHIDRLIISGHNLYEQQVEITVQEAVTDSAPSYEHMHLVPDPGLNSIDRTVQLCQPGPIDLHWLKGGTDGIEGHRFVRLTFDETNTGNVYEIGELFLGETIEPTSGVVNVWTDNEEPNNRVATTQSGRVYSLQRGDPRQVWTIAYQRITPEDAALLVNIRELSGFQLHPFWFDTPESGDYITTNLIEFVSSGGVNGSWDLDSNLDTTFRTASGYGGNVAMETEILSSGQRGNTFRFDAPLAQNWKGKIISIDVEMSSAAWVNAPGDVFLVFFDDADSAQAHSTGFNVGQVFSDRAVQNAWRRIYIDLGNPSMTLNTTFSGPTPVDFSRITDVRFMMNGSSGNRIQWSNFRIMDPVKAPVFVELIDFRKEQSAQNPGFATRFDITMVVREVLS